MPNLLVTGGNGQLGSELRDLERDASEHNFFFTDAKDLDITDYSVVKNYVIDNKIDVIINCAAYTAVDKAESELQLCNEINHLAVKNFAELAKERGIQLVHVSTDYVFDGTSHTPYVESQETNPKSVYGKTKLDAELAIEEINPGNSIIIRTSWVYSSYGNNFVKTMLRLGKERDELGVIFDQIGTPTYAKDLARVILKIIPKLDNNDIEVFHFSNEGVCSWFDFAKAIFDIAKLNVKVNPIETNQYPTPAERPSYSLLNKSKIKNKFEIEIPYWRDSLIHCLQKMG